ncbi:MAG: AraC family transcriptional regulator [Bacteroidales bacterium]|nr:AraC family transcriptional regulator [Bacteroidales bacterium]
MYLIGPLLFWYVRSILKDRTAFKKSDLWHLIPMVVFFLAALPELFAPWSDKLEAATAIVNDTKAMEFYKPTLLSHIFSYTFLFISRPLWILVYVCWSFILLMKYRMRKWETKIFAGQRFMFKWLSVLLVSLMILVFSHTLLIIGFTLEGSNLFVILIWLKVISLISLMILFLSPFFFPEVLYGLPRIPENLEIHQQHLPADLPVNKHEKIKSEFRFEKDYLTHIRDKAELCMHELHPYLQPDFTIAQLSVLIHVPVHHLAYYFREVEKKTFSDYRNQWRVEHAKNLIMEGKSSDLTLEAIGILSGFSSRNTFLHAFKKMKGISPHSFLTQTSQK